MGPERKPRLQRITETLELAMQDCCKQTGRKQREVGEFLDAVQSWACNGLTTPHRAPRITKFTPIRSYRGGRVT